MKKLFLGIFILIFATAVFAGGSIFKNKRKERNTNGVESIGMHICGSLKCPPIKIIQGSCKDKENASLHWGVCMCNEGFVSQNNQCVVDRGSSCNQMGSCNAGYFCNFGAENTPNQCEKIASEELEYNGAIYLLNSAASFSNWCRSSEGTNDCQYGYLTYYSAYDWCSMQGARLLNSEELPSDKTEWLSKLHWDGYMSAYWLDNGRIETDGTVMELGDATGFSGAGGVVCIKDGEQESMNTTGEARWLEIADCECDTEKGISLDPSDELCNIQCCKNKHGDNSYYTKGVCAKNIDDLSVVCAARCPDETCPTGDESTPMDDYCWAYYEGLI
ncbi:MAG: hypothetical protein E7021_02165 [Alphaproteobacteria bacterium]|nr:hypothetical protein [Alphaproteobacteria bacterium]